MNQDVEKYGVLLNEGQAEVVEFVKARLRQLLMTKMFAMTLSMQWCLLSKPIYRNYLLQRIF